MINKISSLLVIIISLSSCATIKFSDTTKIYNPPIPYDKNIKVALVLGAGGAKGLAHVGVIEELLINDIKPDLIVGSSAGAIVGSMYADSLDIQLVKSKLINGSRKNFITKSFATLPISLYSNDKMIRFLEQNIQAENIEQLKLPFIAVATNLQFGTLTPFSQGPIVPAVMASASYPGAFYPVKIHNQYFVDGGVTDPIPVNIAKKMGAKIIIAVNIASSLTKSPPNHLIGVVKRSLEISYLHQNTIVSQDANILINVDLGDVDTFTDKYNDFIYNQGRKAAKLKIKEIKKLLK